MPTTCPACAEPIPADDINMSQGAALCRGCGKLTPVSELLEVEQAGDGQAAPLTKTLDGWRVEASPRSASGAFILAGVALFWNGILTVFLLVAASATWQHLGGTLPAWFPNISAQGAAPGTRVSLATTIFLWVFLIPFEFIGVGLILGFLSSVIGSMEVESFGSQAHLRRRIGPLRWTRRLDPARVTKVEMEEWRWTRNDGSPCLVIRLDADRTLRFGEGLPTARREWLQRALRDLLTGPEPLRRQLLAQMPG